MLLLMGKRSRGGWEEVGGRRHERQARREAWRQPAQIWSRKTCGGREVQRQSTQIPGHTSPLACCFSLVCTGVIRQNLGQNTNQDAEMVMFHNALDNAWQHLKGEAGILNSERNSKLDLELLK